MFEIRLLADRPDLVAPLADAYEREWPGWYCRGQASASADLQARVRREGLPLGLVALEDEVPVAACALVTTGGPIESTLLPWLGGLLVLPEWRRRGIASLLIDRAVIEARRQGHAMLYASTHHGAPLFHRLGWRRRETYRTADGPLDIFETPSRRRDPAL
jgi:predicted N-acetyltransferase YhbS